MKIILLNDVPKVGQKYDVKEVANGYAQNFLIPKKLAIQATSGAVQEIEKKKEEERLTLEKQDKVLLESLSKLKGTTLTLKERAADTGGLFSSVDKGKIVSELKKQHNIKLLEKNIELEKPLKEVGKYEITVVIEDKKTKFKLVIEVQE